MIIIFSFQNLSAQQQTPKEEITFKDSIDGSEILIPQMLIKQDINLRNIEHLQLYIPNVDHPSYWEDTYPGINNFGLRSYAKFNELDSFNKSVEKVLLLKYRDLTKYDLGLVGKYLGISKNILAIILAILSAL